ncbi:hypothetical protein HN51_058128 [Arachis hypogaea]|nr:uncharacterized protein DS421_20g685720 [Arachis hypogaea]
MGKKVSQTALAKISKINQKQQQNNFSSLIKVLKPKVYITDSSSFKKLVQELTGNNNETASTTITTSFPPPLVDENLNLNFLSTSSKEGASRNSFEMMSSLSSSSLMNNEEFKCDCDEICLQDMVFEDSAIADNQSLENMFTYHCQNLESLLFDDTDPNQFHDCYAQIEQQLDASIYDYEFYEII